MIRVTDFPLCVLLNSSLDIALTCSTVSCVQVVIVRARATYEQKTTREPHEALL